MYVFIYYNSKVIFGCPNAFEDNSGVHWLNATVELRNIKQWFPGQRWRRKFLNSPKIVRHKCVRPQWITRMHTPVRILQTIFSFICIFHTNFRIHVSVPTCVTHRLTVLRRTWMMIPTTNSISVHSHLIHHSLTHSLTHHRMLLLWLPISTPQEIVVWPDICIIYSHQCNGIWRARRWCRSQTSRQHTREVLQNTDFDLNYWSLLPIHDRVWHVQSLMLFLYDKYKISVVMWLTSLIIIQSCNEIHV